MLRLEFDLNETIYIGKDIKIMFRGIVDKFNKKLISCHFVAPKEMKVCQEYKLNKYYSVEEIADMIIRLGPPNLQKK